jgi:hypothetical protein
MRAHLRRTWTREKKKNDRSKEQNMTAQRELELSPADFDTRSFEEKKN